MRRFIFSDNNVLKDNTIVLENYHSGNVIIDYKLGEDSIFIGSELPFNSLFFNIITPNSNAVGIDLKYWSCRGFNSMVEVLDETNGFTNSGHINWTPDKRNCWRGSDTIKNNGLELITGLGNVIIYDLYWLKLDFDADCNFEINWLGTKFCDNNDVINEYTLSKNSTFIANYADGKTSWDNEIILASRLIVEDIKKKRVIISEDQLLERRLLRDACVSKVMQIIFKNMGDDYKSDAERAQKEYELRITKNNYGADLNKNGRLDQKEKGWVNGVLYR